ncbi:MAG: thiamine diphosphokinase [Bacteroidaceae bacterium]|nr:thiamine diphosphokinase [Bacteroidaceae bacterium]
MTPRATLCWTDFQVDAVILAAGDFPCHPVPSALLDHPRVVCCDSAAEAFLQSRRALWRCIGDGDSLPESVKRDLPFIHVAEQETNDLTKAVRLVVEELGADARVAIIGATGKREDHTIGNISLLAEYLRIGLRATMLTDHGVFLPCRGSRVFTPADFHPACDTLQGRDLSIFNLTCRTLASEGLQYDVYPFRQWWQGTLNRILSPTFRITADGDYLVYLRYFED